MQSGREICRRGCIKLHSAPLAMKSGLALRWPAGAARPPGPGASQDQLLSCRFPLLQLSPRDRNRRARQRRAKGWSPSQIKSRFPTNRSAAVAAVNTELRGNLDCRFRHDPRDRWALGGRGGGRTALSSPLSSEWFSRAASCIPMKGGKGAGLGYGRQSVSRGEGLLVADGK